LLLLRNGRILFSVVYLLRMIGLNVYGILFGQPVHELCFLITIIVNKTGFAS